MKSIFNQGRKVRLSDDNIGLRLEGFAVPAWGHEPGGPYVRPGVTFKSPEWPGARFEVRPGDRFEVI